MLRSRFARTLVAVVVSGWFFSSASLNAQQASAFPKAKLSIDVSKAVKTDAPKLPSLGYLAPDVGAFSLNGAKGHATYVWYHGLTDVDMHSHDLAYLGESSDGKFWLYKIDKHSEYIAFAKDKALGENDYRIFYIAHGETHLWSWKASRFHLHVHN